jgi:hypothetical protein
MAVQRQARRAIKHMSAFLKFSLVYQQKGKESALEVPVSFGSG